MKWERKEVEEPVLKFAKRAGILALKGTPASSTGWPDYWFLYKGSIVFMEFKRPGKDLERNQPERIDQLVEQRFTVGVFDDARIAISFLEATLLSKEWREAVCRPGLCRITIQARSRQDVRDIHGDPHTPGQTVRR